MASPSMKVCMPEESRCHHMALRVVTSSQAWPVVSALDHGGGISHPFGSGASNDTGYNREPSNPIPGVNPKWGGRPVVVLDPCVSPRKDLRKTRHSENCIIETIF